MTATRPRSDLDHPASASQALAVAVPGTAGEIVQGMIDGIHVHISAPIDRYSQAAFDISGAPLVGTGAGAKTIAAAAKLLGNLGQADHGRLHIESSLPHGKGLGSSTADIAAACYAIAASLGQSITPREVAAIALSVEPTDGSVFPGIVMFDHRAGRRYEQLGSPPALEILVFDPGGVVDTIAFNAADFRAALTANEDVTIEAVGLARAAIAAGDVRLLGQAASLSAAANDAVLPKPYLASVRALADDTGGVGVCVAHSGVILGIMYDPVHADVVAASAYVSRRLAGGWFRTRLVTGGPRYRVLPHPG